MPVDEGQMTRDKKVVVFHDLDLARIFGPNFRGKRVADLDYKELPAFPPTTVHTSVHTSATHPPSSLSCPPVMVPLLEDVFREFQSFPIQVMRGCSYIDLGVTWDIKS